MRHIDSPAAAADLGHEILSARQRPLVLISSDGESAFPFDPALVAREVGEAAEVVTIATGDVTFALERVLPQKTHVFGGAARSYPPDFGDSPDWWRSVLRFPGRHDTTELIDDALAQVTSLTGIRERDRRAWVTATVERVSGATGNIARLENGTRVMVNADLLPPQVQLEDALVEGAAVEGWLAGLDLSPEPADPDLGEFTDGDITLTRVVKVTEHRVVLRLHPLSPDVALRRRDVVPGSDAGENTDVRLEDVVHVGETVRARVNRRGGSLALSLLEVDQDVSIVPPLALIRGGASWLSEGQHAPNVEDEQSASIHDQDEAEASRGWHPPAPISADGAPVDHLADEVKALRSEIGDLRGAFGRLARDLRAGTDLESLDRLRDEAAQLSSELHRERSRREEGARMIARLTQELREARAPREQTTVTARTSREDWPDSESWVRHEIDIAWASRVTASEKARYPVRAYRIGPRFADSLSMLDPAQFTKAMRAAVDVVTGRVAVVPGRDLHRLRDGSGGDDPYVVRADGAKCWRASIENNAPSARRLHYWQLTDGGIELSRVVVHDDFNA
ncbi:hypothetical protein [Microbacterium lacticum]